MMGLHVQLLGAQSNVSNNNLIMLIVMFCNFNKIFVDVVVNILVGQDERNFESWHPNEAISQVMRPERRDHIRRVLLLQRRLVPFRKFDTSSSNIMKQAFCANKEWYWNLQSQYGRLQAKFKSTQRGN